MCPHSDNQEDNTVCALTVTFNPNLELLSSQLSALQSQCELLIIDNGSKTSFQSSLQACCNRFNATCIFLGDNYGIATAQNRGIKYIREHIPKCAYVLLLDHDSIPKNDFILTMLAAYKQLSNKYKVAAVGPAIHEARSNQSFGFHVIKGIRYLRIRPEKMKSPAIYCTTINSSGTLIPLSVLDVVGDFDESLFIDHVETEWCFRLKNHGLSVFGIRDAILEHRMGDDVLTIGFLGIRFSLPNRSPARHRYLIRNSVLLIKRSYTPVVWKFYCILKIIFTFLLFGLFSKQAKSHRHNILTGISDGLHNKSGKIAPD